MSNGRTRRVRRAAISLCSVSALTVIGIASVPSVSNAEPEPTVEQARQKVETLRHDAELAAERSNELKDNVKQLDKRVGKLSSDAKRQQKRVETLRSKIEQYVSAQYRSGGVDPTVKLMLSDNPDEFLEGIGTAQAVSGQLKSTVTSLQAEKKALAEKKAAEKAERDRQREAKASADKKFKSAKAKSAKAEKLLDRLTEEQRQRIEQQQDNGPEDSPAPPDDEDIPVPPGSGKGGTALAFAKSQLGDPYSFGAEGPDSFDCSGLTLAAWGEAGVSLPHSSRDQYAQSAKLSSESELRPGDLVIFYSDQHHVGLYAGDGQVIHAPKPGSSVEYAPMDSMPVTGMARPG